MRIFRRTAFLTLLLLSLFAACGHSFAQASTKDEYLMYVGTYTAKDSKGIYVYRYDGATGKLQSLGLAAEAADPSFLAIHPDGRFLYAVNETEKYKDQASGGVSAFAIDRQSGKLMLLNELPSRGSAPCYVSFDRTGKYVLVANYGGGSLTVFPMLTDGRLGEASAFVQHTGSSVRPEQKSAHAHSIDLSADNRFAIAADLGMDEVVVYRFDANRGRLTPNQPRFAKLKPGAGPRHFTFHPNGRSAYVVNELDSTVTSFSYDRQSGTLRELQTISTLPKDFTRHNDDAEIHVHPNGRFLYASNRGHDSIAVFAIDGEKGTLTFLEAVPTQGKTPRYFGIDPTGTHLLAANQDSGTIVVFNIDPKSGRLTPTGQVLQVPSPVCLAFVKM